MNYVKAAEKVHWRGSCSLIFPSCPNSLNRGLTLCCQTENTSIVASTKLFRYFLLHSIFRKEECAVKEKWLQRSCEKGSTLLSASCRLGGNTRVEETWLREQGRYYILLKEQWFVIFTKSRNKVRVTKIEMSTL